MLIPITIDQMRAAMHPDDWTDHVVTPRDAELLGLSFRHNDAEAKFHAWMLSRGWQPDDQAAGCVRWRCGREYMWLDGGVAHAAATMIGVFREDETPLPQHGRVRQRDTRPGLDILAEIANTVPAAAQHAAAAQWDGGGTFVLVTR
jgi:hypothetical protein